MPPIPDTWKDEDLGRDATPERKRRAMPSARAQAKAEVLRYMKFVICDVADSNALQASLQGTLGCR